jgi:hypothetical protein
VRQIIMVDDFSAEGWTDYQSRVVGVGPVPPEHPTGGSTSSIVPISLAEELVRRAVLSVADIEIVQTEDENAAEPTLDRAGGIPRSEPARLLDELGGVAALLRY